MIRALAGFAEQAETQVFQAVLVTGVPEIKYLAMLS
jgi:hypothetical protein